MLQQRLWQSDSPLLLLLLAIFYYYEALLGPARILIPGADTPQGWIAFDMQMFDILVSLYDIRSVAVDTLYKQPSGLS